MFGRELDARDTPIERFREGDVPADRDGHSEAQIREPGSAREDLRPAQRQHSDIRRKERLVAVLPAPVVVTDESGLVRTANGSAAELLGLSADRLVDDSLFTFMEATCRDELRRLLAEAVEARRDLRSTATLCPARGEPVRVDVAATTRDDPGTGGAEVTWVLLGDGVISSSDADERTRGRYLARSLVELTQLPLSASGISEVLAPMAGACQRAFSHPVEVSIIIGEPGRPDFVATGSKLAQSLDGAQVTAGEGPAQTAWGEGRTVRSEDLRADRRWPRLHRHLATSRVRSAVALPIRFADKVVGVLNLYSEDGRVTGEAAVESAELLGTTVAAVLHEAEAKSELEDSTRQLQAALESRSTIDQAKGMIMASRGCGPDEAFQILVDMSSTANVKLRDIAARMVEEASQGTKVHPDQRPNGGRSSVDD